MKKIIFLTISIFVFGFAFPTFSFTQGMMGNITGVNNTTLQDNDGHTAREEAEGKAVWEKLQAKELTCKDLSNDNFGALGEYFMGQMFAPSGSEASPSGIGASHEAMNNMMIRMMGKEGEEQMHIAMGKRMSGCDPNAQMPKNMMDMMSMMGGMMNGRTWSMGNMMGWSNFGLRSGWTWLGWIFMLLFWILIIIWIIVPVKWLIDQITGKGKEKEKSSLDILKERYAKGEIDKKEFEEKKKDLI